MNFFHMKFDIKSVIKIYHGLVFSSSLNPGRLHLKLLKVYTVNWKKQLLILMSKLLKHNEKYVFIAALNCQKNYWKYKSSELGFSSFFYFLSLGEAWSRIQKENSILSLSDCPTLSKNIKLFSSQNAYL